MQETPVRSLGWKDPLEKGRLSTPVFLGFPCGSAGKESACDAGDLGSIPGLERSPGEGKDYPLQYSGLDNSMVSERVGYDWVTYTFTLSLHAWLGSRLGIGEKNPVRLFPITLSWNCNLNTIVFTCYLHFYKSLYSKTTNLEVSISAMRKTWLLW